MVNDLIVMAFDDAAAASKAKQALEQMRTSPFLGILNALVVTRDRAGKVVVHEQWELPAHLPSASKQMPRLLVEAFLGKLPEDAVQQLVNTGLGTCLVPAPERRRALSKTRILMSVLLRLGA